MKLVVIPESGARALDKHVASFRATHPEATDEDAEGVRQQLLDALLKYGHIPEFEIVKSDEKDAEPAASTN